jgi:uncharacterized protein (DUF952 family)
LPTSLFHIALAADWQAAQRDGVYRVSTLGRRLDEQGYIHLSFAHQVKPVADRVYRGTGDLLLLQIDPARLAAPVVVEPGEGTDEQFPHLYGELPVDVVIDVHAYSPDDTGSFPPVG